MKKINWFLIVTILLSLFSVLSLFGKGFFPTHDSIHVARIYEMDKVLREFQFPPRWMPDFWYGEPTFNFYAPFPYYLGFLIHLLGFDFLTTTKLLFALSLIFSSISMFYLGRYMWGNWGGLVSAVFYTFAPYHAVDVYVRGALSESWALVFFPIVILSFTKLISEKEFYRPFLASVLSFSLFILTHNLMALLFLPFLGLYLLMVLVLEKKLKDLRVYLKVFAALVVGLLVSAYYWVPAFFEKKYINEQALLNQYFDFRGHFVAIGQFFKPFWGYGASVWGPGDGLSFQLGLVHWFVIFIVFFWTIKQMISRKKEGLILVGILLLFTVSLFMQHNKSISIWLFFESMLRYVQFPWRFLGISIFWASLMAGAVNLILARKKIARITVIVTLVAVVILVNISYFKPEKYYKDSIDKHYTTEFFSSRDRQSKDYLPRWVERENVKEFDIPRIVSGQRVNVEILQQRSNSLLFNINLSKEDVVILPIYYFPGWKVFVNGQSWLAYPQEKSGLIIFPLKEGVYKVFVKFEETPLRLVSDWTSAIAVFGLIFVTLLKKKSLVGAVQ